MTGQIRFKAFLPGLVGKFQVKTRSRPALSCQPPTGLPMPFQLRGERAASAFALLDRRPLPQRATRLMDQTVRRGVGSRGHLDNRARGERTGT